MNPTDLFSRFVILAVFALMQIVPSALQATVNDPTTINVGVLAEEGKDRCFSRWRPTGTYLHSALPEFAVNIVCLGFDEIEKAVYEGRVDFSITNPAIYANLEYIYGSTRIATFKSLAQGEAATQFGGVIFTSSDRKDLKTIADLKGKRFAAVDKDSFGGWLIAWRTLKRLEIDPFKDFAALDFIGQHRRVVHHVLQGKADAGNVRTGILEQMASEGLIDAGAYSVINPRPEGSFPYATTTELYPQWALARSHHVSLDLATRVMFAFLKMDPASEAAQRAESSGWTIPLDYYPVHQCLQDLKTGPYAYLNSLDKVTIGQFYKQYRLWVHGGIGASILILGAMAVVFFLNRKLATTTLSLRSEQREKEKTLADLNDFKTTLDRVRDSVFMFDPDSLRFLYVNHGGLDQLGYSLEEMLQMTPLSIKPDYTESQFRDMITPLRDFSKDSLTLITQHRRKDGSLLPVEVFLQHIIPEGKKSRYVAIVRDITKRMEQRQERERLQARLGSEQKLASIGQLAAGISHEINTPAQYLGSNIDFLGDAFTDVDTLITGYDKLLESMSEALPSGENLIRKIGELKDQTDWGYLAEEIPRAISQSREGIAKISSIVLAMKEFSHPGCEEKQPTDLNKLIETTLTVASNEWKFVAEIDRQLDDTLPQVLCMPSEMGQVFLNILVNAAHAIQEKIGADTAGAKGKITIGSRLGPDKQVEITFTDTGCGIPQTTGDKVFDPFFTTKEVGRGTGQGLAISYDIVVSKHRGSLDFVSAAGEGSTFTVRLPVEGTAQLYKQPQRRGLP